MTSTDKAFYLIGKYSNKWLRTKLDLNYETITNSLSGKRPWSRPESLMIQVMFKDETKKPMIYQDFIDLGFKRIEMDDQVAFKHTGYPSFCLEYKLNNGDYLSCAYPDFHVNLYDCEGDLIERNVDARMHIKKDRKPLTNYTYLA